MLLNLVSVMLLTGIVDQLSRFSATPVFTPDISLLRSWKNNAPQLCKYPCVAQYSDRDSVLSFVASRHENTLSSKSFGVIRREFLRFQPQVVIIEGRPFADGFSPQNYINGLHQDMSSEFWKYGEPSYAATLAANSGIAFIGGEPTDAQMASSLREAGYTDRDMMGFFLIQQIPPWKRQNLEQSINLSKFLDEFQNVFEEVYSLDKLARFSSVDAFKDWFMEKNARKFDVAKIDANVTAPIDKPSALFTQRMAAIESKRRDAWIVSVIADMLNRYHRVMIVYGAGHLYQQADVLKKMLGHVVIIHR